MRYLCNTLALALSSALILSCVFMESANKSANTSHPPPPPPPPPKSSSSSSLAKSSSSSKIAVNFLNDKRDGKKYIIVKIGTQTWMAENLKYNAKDSKCYNNKRDNCDAYGRLYDWKTAMSSCPQGWHLPTDGEWNTLVNYAGGKERAGKKLKAKNGWMDFEGKDGNGTDDYGFSALAGGHGDSEGKFSYIGYLSFWWSDNMEAHSEFASSWYINSRGNAKNNDYFRVDESYFGFVRCIKD